MISLHNIRYEDLWTQKRTIPPLTLTVDAETKVVIISDSHLDTTVNADQFNSLKKIIQEADQIILNGDFWLDKHITFQRFISSPWSKLFPLLKSKNTYYLFGNHDMPSLSDDRMYLFCTQAGFQLKMTAGTKKFHIEHGHLLSEGVIQKTLLFFENNPRLLGIITKPLEIVNESLLRVLLKQKSKIPYRINNEFKKNRFRVSDAKEYFAMGHTHLPEIDEDNKYLNSGRTHRGYFSYITIYQNNIVLFTNEG